MKNKDAVNAAISKTVMFLMAFIIHAGRSIKTDNHVDSAESAKAFAQRMEIHNLMPKAEDFDDG